MIIRAMLWLFTGKLCNQIVSLSIVMVLARLLTPEDFGIVAASQVILTLSQVVVRFGIGSYLVQVGSASPRMIRTSQTLMLIIAVSISTGLFFLTEQISYSLKLPELVQIMPVLLMCFVLSAASNPSASLLARDMEFKYIALVEVASQAVGYGFVAIGMAVLGFGYWSLIAGIFAQTLINALLIFYRKPVWPTLSFCLSEIQPMLRFGGGVFLAQIMSSLAQRVDNLIITASMGASDLGFYSRAYGLMELSNRLIGSVFRESLFSGFSKKRRKGQHLEIESTFFMGHTFAAFLIVPISALMWLLAEEIIWVVLGEGWASAVPILRILCLGMFFRLGYKVSGTFLMSEGVIYRLAFRNSVYAFLVGLGAWIGSFYGLHGVAWGVLIALIIHFTSMTNTALILCKSDWHRYWQSVSPFIVAGVLSWVIACLVKVVIFPGSAFSNLFAAFIFTIVYCCFIYAVRNVVAVERLLAKLQGIMLLRNRN